MKRSKKFKTILGVLLVIAFVLTRMQCSHSSQEAIDNQIDSSQN